MKCPVCSIRLREWKVPKAVLDVCPQCRGIWFDRGEFVAFVKDLSESDDVQSEEVRLFEKRVVEHPEDLQEPERCCPRCGQGMRKFNYAYDSNVFLDRCRECEGIWADGGEVRKVARYLKENPKVRAIGVDLVKRQRDIYDTSDLMGRGYYPWLLYGPMVIIPLSDDTPRYRFPYITVCLIGMCVLNFILQLTVVGESRSYYQQYGSVPNNIFSIGLLTSMFLHGGWIHLIGNMFFLWLFGDNVEDRFSRLGYLGFYLLCGISADLVHAAAHPGCTTPSIGASGAISGVMGAYLYFYPSSRIKVFCLCRIIHVPALFYLGFWFGLQMYSLTITSMTGGSNIAWYAHIGGFVFGYLFVFGKTKLMPCRDKEGGEKGRFEDE